MRGKGINYDTGTFPDGMNTRELFDADIVRREMRIIADELHCTAVRVTGGDPERISVAGEAAAAAGLEVWFSPFPAELGPEQLAPFFADCADRAEQLRRTGARVVLVTGCELTLFGAGFLPGDTCTARLNGLMSRREDTLSAFAELPGKLNTFLGSTAEAVRGRFGGPVSYASGTWEPADWAPFDIASQNAYRDAGNATAFPALIHRLHQHGKPVVITEFGCCTYVGAGARGGAGWTIIDASTDPPSLDGDYVRDEDEQVRYLDEVSRVFTDENVDLAFWFTFALYPGVHDPDPRRDLDMASYGVVKMLPGGPGTGYQGLGWEPKLAFGTLAKADWQAASPAAR
jgi:hypothetical protein